MRTLMDVLDARPKDRVIAAPGVYDMVSLRMAAAMGFEALYMTGYGTVASHLGLPDAGLASYADMVGRVEAMARMAETPLIADGDTGYGGLLNVRHTVRGYERSSSRTRNSRRNAATRRTAGSLRQTRWFARSRSQSKRGRAPIFSSSPAPT